MFGPCFLLSYRIMVFCCSELRPIILHRRLRRYPRATPFCPPREKILCTDCARRTTFCQKISTGYLAVDRYNRNVHIKVVPSSSAELRIVKHLSSNALRADPRNHTIPTICILPAGEWTFIVQPWWGTAWSPLTCNSALDRLMMALQLIEGLAFYAQHRCCPWRYTRARTAER